MVYALKEEAAMANNRLLVFTLITMLSLVAATAFPADELFDTMATAKHMEQGFSYLKAKNYDAAIKAFEESAEISPEAESYYYLGYAYYLKSRKDNGQSRQKSLENFEKAYEIDPNFSPTRYKPSGPSEPKLQTSSKPSETAEPIDPQQAEPKPPTADQPKP
jgi:tetratricopeptide (TPR) repeat protein